MARKLGSELEFISRIKRDGSGTVVDDDYSHLTKTKFRMSCLSITYGTWIASEFNSYVVKLKPNSQQITPKNKNLCQKQST